VTDLGNLPPLESASRYIIYALEPGSAHQVGCIIRAGAYLRAYRRTLPNQGTKVADLRIGDERTTDDQLLWQALGAITALGSHPRQQWFTALQVRRAEAALRVWWKRQQEAS
jgi:hypothetical protein